MKGKIQLNNKWEFIGAELYKGSKWVACNRYVKGMIWDFHPQYFSPTRMIGCIIESTPKENSVDIPFSYNFDEAKLTVEIYTDSTTGITDQSEVDVYEVTSDNETSNNNPTIKLSILTEHNCPPPYFRYILQKIE
ncbi:MAG: hypothetical protein SNF68_08480 [Rikenellaceae bacterium]